MGNYKKTLTTSFFLLICCPWGSAHAEAKTGAHFELVIKPTSLEKTEFEIRGLTQFAGSGETEVRWVLLPFHRYAFTAKGTPIEVKPGTPVFLNIRDNQAETRRIHFSGTSRLQTSRCGATDGEIFCLNNSLPNPELETEDDSTYEVKFDLPTGYAGLAADSDVGQKYGLQFQVAKFGQPIQRKSPHFDFEYVLPADFTPDRRYFSFLEATLEKWREFFGELPFKKIKIGAIRRGQTQGDINGSPSGNLILFSRTAFGDKPNQAGLEQMGITRDLADPLRKLIIAHEASHFWFGTAFQGKDGWMVEGIPHYLGLYALRQDGQDLEDVLKYFKHLDKGGPKGAISNAPFGDGPNYVRAYFQGPLALYTIGEEIGHETLIRFLASIFKREANPAFSSFDQAFRSTFPSKVQLWESAWRLKGGVQ